MRILIITGILFFAETVFAVENEKRSPRLKFKDGPVCMCTDGLSEKDIRASRGADKDSVENGSTNKSEQFEESHSRNMEDK